MSAQSPTADRMLEIVVPAARADELRELLDSDGVAASWLLTENEDLAVWKAAVTSRGVERVLDRLEEAFTDEPRFRAILYALEATLPRYVVRREAGEKAPQRVSRAELYEDVAGSAALNRMYLIQVALATVVAAVGLARDNTAVVIGAMVIAPLLGPILGFSMGAALGDFGLLKRSSMTLAGGIGLSLLVAWLLSFILPINLESRELMSRAEVRLDGVALAMAAGGAAALSLTRGQASALVGVMVAAALLPPGAALGLFAGAGEWQFALRAALLLALNIACLVLAALIVFRLRQIKPRTWIEQKNANRAMWINATLSAFFLLLAAGLIIWLDLGAEVSVG